MEMIIDKTDVVKAHWKKINVDRFFKPSKIKKLTTHGTLPSLM